MNRYAKLLPVVLFCLAVIPGAELAAGEADSAEMAGEETGRVDEMESWTAKEAGTLANWELVLSYPEFNHPEIDEGVKRWLDSHIQDLMAKTSDGIPVDRPETRTTAEVVYCVSSPGPNAVSVLFQTILYQSGNAHSSSTLDALNFSADGKPLALDDLFADPDKALAIMAEQAPALLRNEIADDVEEGKLPNRLEEWIAEGTKPTRRNYSCLTLEPEGVRVHFRQYQVVPYVMGMPDVLIPLAALAPAGPNAGVWRMQHKSGAGENQTAKETP